MTLSLAPIVSTPARFDRRQCSTEPLPEPAVAAAASRAAIDARGIPIFLILIIAAPQGFNIVPFSGSLQCGNATRLQADDGSDRGHARWLFRRAKVSVGPGDRGPPAPRVEHARPFFDEFWRFGPDKGTSIDFGQATRAAGAGAARVVEGVSAVRATHPVLYLTHARAFATYRCTRGYPVVPVASRSALPIARASDGHQRRRKGDRHFESLDLT
jgi:hypothetical protein